MILIRVQSGLLSGAGSMESYRLQTVSFFQYYQRLLCLIQRLLLIYCPWHYLLNQ